MLGLFRKRLRRGEISIDIDERFTAFSRGLSHDLAGEDGMAAGAVCIHDPAIEATDRVDQTWRSGFQIAPKAVGEADIAFASILTRKGQSQAEMFDAQNIPAERAVAFYRVMRPCRAIDADQHTRRLGG